MLWRRLSLCIIVRHDCGNAAEAKKTVTGFLTAFGWNTIDIGGIEGARILEPLGLLWVTYATRTNSRNHAFKLLRKENDLATTGLPRI